MPQEVVSKKIFKNHLKKSLAIHLSCYGVQKIWLSQLYPGVRNRITTLTALPFPGTPTTQGSTTHRALYFIMELSNQTLNNFTAVTEPALKTGHERDHSIPSPEFSAEMFLRGLFKTNSFSFLTSRAVSLAVPQGLSHMV